MSPYTVSPIALAPIPGVHHGTGPVHDTGFATVVSASVSAPGNLQFVGANVGVTTMLFQLDSTSVVPNWFGVAVPDGIRDFTRPNIFFHPTPGQAGYNDADYPTKAGLWPRLFYYMELLGKQVAGAGRSQIVIMPFLTNAATDTGILPAIWHDTVSDILTQVRAALGADDGSVLTIAQVVVSSFSDAILYSHSFRTRATDLTPAEIWDLDGGFSSYRPLSTLLETDPHALIQYDSSSPSYTKSLHVPWPRWADFYDKSLVPKTALQVHPLIRDFMFLDATTRSGVGALIAPPTPAPAPVPSVTPQPPAVPAPIPTPTPVPVPSVAPQPPPVPGPIPTPVPAPTVAPQPPPVPSPPPPTPAPIVAPQPPSGPTPTPTRAPVAVPSVAPQPPPVPSPPTPTPVPAPTVAPQPPPMPGPAIPVPTPVPAATPSLALAAQRQAEGGCCVAVAGIAAIAATTAQAAITAIAAIASPDGEA
jgi:hypothetical protein